MAKIDRDDIINRAIKLMLTGGYDGTSMAQIADACGLRKASLYHHFPDKDALVLAAGASALSMWTCGQLAGKVGKKRLLLVLYVIRALSLAFLAMASDIWHLYAFALIYGISSMPIIPLKTGLIGDLFGANALGSILGSVWFLHQVLAALAVFLGGWVRVETGSYALAFWSAAVLLALGAVSTSFVRKAGGPVLPAPKAAGG